MQHGEDSQEIVRQGEGRDQWLAMQSAYAEYRRASEALDCSHPSADDLLTRRGLEAIQRVAFEQYMEARLAFLEFRFDESNRPRENPGDAPTRGRVDSLIGSRFGNYGLLFLAVAIGLSCATAFSVIRAQRRVHDLEAARDRLQTELSAARDEIQREAKKMDAGSPAQTQATRQPEQARSVQQQPAAVKAQPVSQTRNASIVRRSYRFSLAPSRQFKRVGPIEVSLRSVDARQNRISLSILSESARLNLQHVRLNQPVRIAGGDHGQRMELVIDRIAADGVHGHLIEIRT